MLRRTILIASVALLVHGCGSNGNEEPEAVPATSADLAGKGFEEVSVTGLELPADDPTRISFSRKGIGFDASCNHQSGSYRIKDGVFVAGPFGTTLVGCGAAGEKREDRVADFLSSHPTAEIEGDELTLAKGDSVMVFRDAGVRNPGENWLHRWK